MIKRFRAWLPVVLLVVILPLAACGGRQAGGTPVPATIEPGEKVGEYDAGEAIQSYASNVLGIAVEVQSAGGQEGKITLPGDAQKSVDAALTLAGATYWAVLRDGLASVSLGDGGISGDLTADIESASLGVFVMSQPGALPANPDEALARIRATFPGIADLEFASRPQQGQGFAFQATTTTKRLDPASGKMAGVAESALVSVTPALKKDRVLVWALVANGTLTKALTF